MNGCFSDSVETKVVIALASDPRFRPVHLLLSMLDSVPDAENLPAAERPSVVAARADWTDDFARAVRALDQKMRGRVLMAILDIVCAPTTPRGDTVKALVSDRRGLWRYRIGDYRLIYYPQPSGIRFLQLGHRSEIYD